MKTATLLEHRAAPGAGPCRFCADRRGPVLVRGAGAEPASCPACGRVPAVVRLVRDPDFYANRRRLDEVNHSGFPEWRWRWPFEGR